MTSSDFAICSVCKSHIDRVREPHDELVAGEFRCQACIRVEMVRADAGVFPLPDHFRATLEPYIVWREDRAIAQFVLDQIEAKGEPG